MLLLVLLLPIAPVAADIPSHTSEKELEDPNWWWNKPGGPVTAAWHPDIWNKVVVNKYKNKSDKEKVIKFGWLIRHPVYPMPKGTDLVITLIIIVSLVTAVFMTPRKYWSSSWLDVLKNKQEWNRVRAIFGALIYEYFVIAILRGYIINTSIYYLMAGNIYKAYYILYLWVKCTLPIFIAFSIIIPTILVTKVKWPYRRNKISIIIAWAQTALMMIILYITDYTLLKALSG